MKTILVAGATGYLGRYATRAFKQHGYRVRVLVRTPGKLDRAGPNLEPAVHAFADDVFVGEVTRPETLRGVCDGVDVVFSSVGITRQRDGLTFRDVDYQGNRNLLDEALRRPVEQFVYVSVFNAHRFEHLAIIEAHEDFVRALRAAPIASTVMRPTGYFSDLGEVLHMARRGRVFTIGDGTNRTNPIHGADLADACVAAVGGTAAEVPVGGPEVLSQNEIAALALDVMGRPSKITHLPAALLHGLVRLVRPFSRQTADLLDFFVTAGRAEGVAPATGTHTLRAHYEALRQHWEAG